MARPPVLRVALTGGIATGKSYCLRRFAELGAPTIDADVIARQVVARGTPALAAIAERFGQGMLAPDGSLDREAMASLVFSEPAARRDLETIVHPEVRATIEAWFETIAADVEKSAEPDPGSVSGSLPKPGVRKARERAGVGIADIPLLFETGRHKDFDVVIVAVCPAGQQLARLLARDSLDEAAARQRLAAQWPIEDKVRRADFVIDTSGRLADTDRQVEQVWETLQRRRFPESF